MPKSKSKTTFLSPTAGYTARTDGSSVVTFQIGNKSSLKGMNDMPFAPGGELVNALIEQEPLQLRVQDYTVPSWGLHNHYPQEVDNLVRANKLLPSLLQKRAQFLYGKGPVLYRTEYDNATGEQKRVYGYYGEIDQWLNSWQNDWKEYLYALIKDYYRYSACASRFVRTISGEIVGLRHLNAADARLATDKQVMVNDYLRTEDFDTVLVGDWNRYSDGKLEVYKQGYDALFCMEPTPGRRIYAYNEWYEGLREWVRASNLTPKYLNNYLKNALNAHIHCKIPEDWYNQQRETLQQLCQTNIGESETNKRLKKYRGVSLTDNSGIPYAYSEAMMQDLVANELDRITEMLSGEGENQGKLYATIKASSGEGWEFTDFPQKFKEYFDAVISLDKRADQVTLAGLGISSSITNVEADGTLSKSGSEVYYNYVVYLNTLTYAEHIICRAINKALREKFPDSGVQCGFRIDIPLRQQEISPDDRLVR